MRSKYLRVWLGGAPPVSETGAIGGRFTNNDDAESVGPQSRDRFILPQLSRRQHSSDERCAP
jgi:hypothetical protein